MPEIQEVDKEIIAKIEQLYELVVTATTEATAVPERYGVLNSLRLMLDRGRQASHLLADDHLTRRVA
jgi:hypothetical protein